MEHIVKISCYPDHFIASMEMGEQILEGEGETMSESLNELALEVEYEEMLMEQRGYLSEAS